MATIINTPGNNDSDAGGGWAVAVVILIIIICIGAYVWLHNQNTAPATNGTTDVNLIVPDNSGTNPSGGTVNSTTSTTTINSDGSMVSSTTTVSH